MNKRPEINAFPLSPEMIFAADEYGGMTLRDYFAAKAMQGMYANDADNYDFEGVSKAAYMTADAMLKTRVNDG